MTTERFIRILRKFEVKYKSTTDPELKAKLKEAKEALHTIMYAHLEPHVTGIEFSFTKKGEKTYTIKQSIKMAERFAKKFHRMFSVLFDNPAFGEKKKKTKLDLEDYKKITMSWRVACRQLAVDIEPYSKDEKEGERTEKERELFWKFIEQAKWKSDHDYERIHELLNKEPFTSHWESLQDILYELRDDLNDRFEYFWTGRDGQGGLSCGDDSWNDLRLDIIARGKTYYEAITEEKIRTMDRGYRYEEGFEYSFQGLD